MKILFLLATLTLLASCTQSPGPTPTPVPEAKVMEETKTMTEDALMMTGEMMDHSGMDMMKANEGEVMKPTGYMSYDESKVSEALVSGQKVALFFHATWCPSCKALDKTISAEISSIPSDTLIVKVDYDSSTEMKKKYGVTNQHTTVLIDREMNLISKKLGAKSVSDVLN